MADKLRGIEENRKNRAEGARQRALETINQLIIMGENVNFNSVHKQSGVSKSFLYDDADIRKRIEEQRKCGVDNEMNRRAKYDKTSRSKDVIIAAKDMRITKLETEVRMLKMELEHLRGLLYAAK
jgi:hypothetical protein